MSRLLPVCAALLMLASFCNADEPTETVIRLLVRPAAAPKSAMRYQLLPELREMNPGNPVPAYLKSFSEQQLLFYNKDASTLREKYRSMPLKDLPDLRDYGGIASRQADYAARLDTLDWQSLVLMRRDGYRFLVPEVQQMRSLAGVLLVRFRGAIATRRFDNALVTAKTMLALARHVGEHPSLVGGLVGISTASMTFDALSEMIGQPGCPNLFWALADLPSPFIDLRKGTQAERLVAEAELKDLDERAPMTDSQVRTAIAHAQLLHDMSSREKDKKRDLTAWVAERARNEAHVKAARKRLIEHGLSAETIKPFSATQVVLLDEKYAYQISRDEQTKVMSLPYWQAAKVMADNPLTQQDVDKSLYGQLVAPIFRVRRSQVRVDQRIALLRCVEAVRIHAAQHDGKLPARLADIQLPLAVDPVTGVPFAYRVENGTAVLRGTPPAGLEKAAAFNVRYEIKIVK